MPRVHAHAAIWIDDKLVVHRHRHRGQTRLSLPGGRVKEREGIIDALHRETREEIGQPIEVGALLVAGQVTRTSVVGLVLVFAAQLRTPELTGAHLQLVGSDSPEWGQILPPLVSELAADGDTQRPAWLGELSLTLPSPAAPAGRAASARGHA